MADTTVRDQVQRTKVHLYGAQRLELRQLTDDVDDVETFLPLDSVVGLHRGSLIGVGEELVYVLAVDDVAPVGVSVVRGFQRSIPTAHAVGALGEVNPRFPAPAIQGALADEIASWGEHLYGVRSATVHLDAGGMGALLPGWAAGCYGLIDVHWCLPGVWPTEDWRRLPRANYTRLVREDLCAPPVLLVGQLPATAVALRATVAVPFDVEPWKPDTDLIRQTGLQRSMLDLPSMGAALRLWSTQEIPRSDRIGQPEPRRAEEVPPGAVSQALAPLANLIRQRKKEESGKLLARFPIRIQ